MMAEQRFDEVGYRMRIEVGRKVSDSNLRIPRRAWGGEAMSLRFDLGAPVQVRGVEELGISMAAVVHRQEAVRDGSVVTRLDRRRAAPGEVGLGERASGAEIDGEGVPGFGVRRIPVHG